MVAVALGEPGVPGNPLCERSRRCLIPAAHSYQAIVTEKRVPSTWGISSWLIHSIVQCHAQATLACTMCFCMHFGDAYDLTASGDGPGSAQTRKLDVENPYHIVGNDDCRGVAAK
jgi:hypothetical protein